MKTALKVLWKCLHMLLANYSNSCLRSSMTILASHKYSITLINNNNLRLAISNFFHTSHILLNQFLEFVSNPQILRILMPIIHEQLLAWVNILSAHKIHLSCTVVPPYILLPVVAGTVDPPQPVGGSRIVRVYIILSLVIPWHLE